MKLQILLAGVWLSPWVSSGANVYVASSATGWFPSGADWGHALKDLPSSLVRGNTYYVATGQYASHGFNDKESGDRRIIIRKATASDHGTAAGWQKSYGEGQAVFAAPLNFRKGYYTIDGQYRANLQGGHGIKVDGRANPLKNWGDIQLGTSDPATARSCVIRYVEIDGSHDRSDPKIYNDNGVVILWGSHAETIEYCSIHDVGGCSVFIRQSTNTVIQQSWLSRNHSTGALHAEGISCSEGADDWTVRYNVFEDIEGTAYIATPNARHHQIANWRIYGNVFAYTPGNKDLMPGLRTGGCGNGVIGIFDCDLKGDFLFENNTIVNFNDAAVGGGRSWTAPAISFGDGLPTTAERFYVRNNLWFNSAGTTHWKAMTPGREIADLQWTHNTYIDCGDPVDADASKAYGVGSPFVDWTRGDYRLKSATTPGQALPAPYDVDPAGKVRGADGIWDRGAFEFAGGSVTNGTEAADHSQARP